jgi:hypothetical protein
MGYNTETSGLKGPVMQIKIVFLLFFILILSSHIYPADLLENLLPADENYTTLFPQILIMRGFVHTHNDEISGPINIVMQNNPETEQFNFAVSSIIFNADLMIDKFLNVKNSEMSYSGTYRKLIEKAGYNKLIYNRKNNGKESDSLAIIQFLDGKEEKRKEISCDRNSFPSDAVIVALQALLYKGIRKGFLFDIISLAEPVKVRMNISYFFTDKVLSLSSDFSFPPEMNNTVYPDKKYHVFKMNVHGLLSLFIRTSWFFVFKADYPYGFVAYWGGNGINEEVYYFPETEYIDND